MSSKGLSFQELILKLQEFWGRQGCAIIQPHDVEVGAGTFHPATVFWPLGPDPMSVAYVQPSRRPTDGRYGDNPNRVQKFHQFQVLIKPSPESIQEAYLASLEYIGMDTRKHDIRFVEDDWESPTLGASGLGWEVWCDGMEVTQYTYFQQMGGFECKPVSVELAYGLERIAMILQGVDNMLDLNWNGGEGDKKITYGDLCLRNEQEFSAYNFDEADADILFQQFKDCELEVEKLLKKKLALPAYDLCIKASHLFNLLDARSAISVAERAAYIARVRDMAKGCCAVWIEKLPKKDTA